MKPDNYKEQTGCHNCEHCFIRIEYDDSNLYYCTIKAPPRPPCGSVCMEESYLQLETDKEWRDADEAWSEWSKNRKVEAWGYCGIHHKTTLKSK